MVPVSLFLRNFLSYGERVPPLDFTQFRVACITGANGHGKSALLDAITYALWGEARKSSHERKPDAGLLRLGAEEMQVEFCFVLDENRFRVIRSFRKGRQVNSTHLELQVFDPHRGEFRSLSEGSSLTKTQQRIEQLLCMDYETFINSAFIVQGRADEFTQKSATQRKEILAEILGLGRYDRLQELSRRHLQERQQEGQALRHTLEEMDRELAAKAECASQLETVSAQLEKISVDLMAVERQLEEVGELRLEQGQVRERVEALERECAAVDRRLQELQEEQLHLQQQQQRDEQILAAEASIQRDFELYQRLREEIRQQEERWTQLQELKAASKALELRIVQARHEVEQEGGRWQISCRELENRLQEVQSLLLQEQTIEARQAQLEEIRRQDQILEQKRGQYEELQRERLDLQHEVELERQALLEQLKVRQDQVENLRRRLAEGEALERQYAEVRGKLDELQQQAQESERLRETGSALRERLEYRRRQLQLQEEELAKVREKIHILQTTPAARCPLCGSRLDESHRRQLDEELSRQERDLVDRQQAQDSALRQLEEELQSVQQQCQVLEERVSRLPEWQRERTQLEMRRAYLREVEIELGRSDEQLAELQQRLAEGRYAIAPQSRLDQIELELGKLDYRPEKHAQLKEMLADLRSVEVDYVRLQEARVQRVKLDLELKKGRERLALVQQVLEEKAYAQLEQQELETLRERLARIDYDSEKHQQLRHRLETLGDVASRREELIAAQQRHLVNARAIERNAAEIQTLHRQRQELEGQRQRLHKRLGELAGIDQQFAALTGDLARHRAERDQWLQRQGALQAQLARCEELTQKREAIRQQLNAVEREGWIYQQLSTAFGKEGIQALIIENAIPEIEREANAILARLTNNRIQLAIESLRDLKKGGTRETLDIKIADEIGERSYHLYSGGEAFRTNFALRIALSRVLALRSGIRLRTLIIDEGFGTQDGQGIEQMVEAIQEISKDFDKVLVVTHLPELKNAFPVQIEVTKYPDLGSRFQIIHNG